MGVSCFAERVVVSEDQRAGVPDSVPPDIAAISACAVITGVGAVLNVVQRAAGQPLAVFGTGGVGLAAVMGAALTGAQPVIAIDIDPVKLELARAVWRDSCLNAAQSDVVDEVLELSDGGVPWMIDAVGRPETMRQAFECLRPAGTLVAIGLSSSRRHGRRTDQRACAAAKAHRRLAVRLQQSADRPASDLQPLPGRSVATRRAARPSPPACRGE